MKTLYLILLFPIITFAQDTHNFKIENGKLVYEKVIQEALTIEQAKKSITRYKGEFILEGEDYFTYQINKENIPYEKWGYKRTRINTLFSYPFSGTINFESRENRYKIRVENITFYSLAGQSLYGGTDGNVSIDRQLTRNKMTALMDNKISLQTFEIYDLFFTEIFQNDSSEEW